LNHQTTEPYDSRMETREHISKVVEYGDLFLLLLKNQIKRHDASKLLAPEKEAFDKISPILKIAVYGSPEYIKSLKDVQPAIDHHYSKNSHHPEHYTNGIEGMNLLDIVEMLLDWKAASLRTKDGNIQKSLEQQIKRFNIDPQLASILKNTIDKLNL